MVVRNSLLTAMCVAGLLGVATVGTANATTELKNLTISVLGSVVTVSGQALTDGSTVTSGIDSSFLGNLTEISTTNLIGFNGTYTGQLAKFSINTLGNPFGGTLSFVTDAPVGFFAAASFSDTSSPTDVPEPGTIAFGVIAAGSVLGLVARKRKA